MPEGAEQGSEAQPAPGSADVPNGKVFISYASQDTAIADALCNALERAGISCWIAPRDVRPGDFYADAIVRAIDASQLLVLIQSRSAAESHHILREVERAAAKRHPVISLRIEATPLPAALEYFLNTSQWIDAIGGDSGGGFAKLIEAVRSRVHSTQATPHSPGPPEGTQKRLALTPALIVGVLLVALVAALLWQSKHEEKRVAATSSSVTSTSPSNAAPAAPAFAPPPHSIAVLPFVNMSGDAKQDYFSDGVSEELLDSLSHLSELQVAARTSSFSFKGQNVDVSVIARKLNVGTVLEGSVRRSGDTVRITVQLINAVSGFHVWSQTYDRKLTDILQVQADLATSVAEQLEIKLIGDETGKIELGGTKNSEAYDAYLRGAQIIIGSNPRAGRDALAAFDQAITLDPNYAKAYAERAWALHSIAISVPNPADRAGLREQARVAAERAVTLAPDLGEAHAILASIRAYALFDYPGAAPEFDRALALAPGSAKVQITYAFYAADLGHTDAAVNAARRGVGLDPQNAWAHAVLGSVLGYARRYREALAAYADAAVLRPGWRGLEANRTQALLAEGQVEQARQECESPATMIEDDDRHYCLALAYHFLGRQPDAERELAKFQALDGDGAAGSYTRVYAQWGDAPSALHWLSTAEHLRDPLLWQLRVDWHLDPIRGEPEFKAILARMNFPP